MIKIKEMYIQANVYFKLEKSRLDFCVDKSTARGSNVDGDVKLIKQYKNTFSIKTGRGLEQCYLLFCLTFKDHTYRGTCIFYLQCFKLVKNFFKATTQG